MTPLRRRSADDERGAVALFTSIVIVVVLIAAAIAVDLGMQRVGRADMQALADVVALDLSREMDGQRKVRDLEAVETGLANASRDRNLDAVGGLDGGKPALDVTWGRFVDGEFEPGGPDDVPNAVQVRARTSVGFAFGGITGTDSGDAQRDATATAEMGACFTVGSYAARINLGDGFILGPLLDALGTSVALDLLDAKGLAAADIALLDLVGTGLVAGGFDQLVDANVSLGQFYLALADVLEKQGGHAAQVALLGRLAQVAVKDVIINVGDVLGVDTGSNAGLAAIANVFDLVAAAAFVANGDSSVAIPAVGISVPGVTNLSANATIGQKPILRCGRAGATRGESSQVDLTLGGNLTDINLGVAVVRAPISIKVSVAPAAADLKNVACLTPKKRLEFMVTSGLVRLEVVIGDVVDKDKLAVKVTGIKVINGHLRLYSTPAPAATETKSVTITEENYDQAPPAEFGDNTLGVPYLHTDSQLKILDNVPLIGYLINTLLGGVVNGVVTPLLTQVVNPLVAALDAVLLSPLLQALGLNVAGADVYARPKADCGVPRLVD